MTLVARKHLLYCGVEFPPGKVLPDVPLTFNGRPRPLDAAALIARGRACDTSCEACDCGFKPAKAAPAPAKPGKRAAKRAAREAS